MNGVSNGPTRSATRAQQAAPAPAAKKPVHFASTSAEILAKYQKYPASVSLHIYDTHYRFNNSQDSQVIPKSSPMIKDFMHHVLKETIPPELSELIKDFSIRSYDGCLILQVYDHRNMVAVSVKQGDETTTVKKPKTYRTLLRPTQLSIYYDLLYHTDAALSKFTDPLSLQMESEILTLTNRNLDLSVPLNPYLCDDYLKPDPDYRPPVWNPAKDDYDVQFNHRAEVASKPRKLHQDEIVLHKSSDYEEIMLLLSNKYKKLDDSSEKKLVVVGQSALGATSVGSPSPSQKPKDPKKPEGSPPAVGSTPTVKSVSSTGPPRATGQFMRLRLIEEYRKKKDANKAAQVKAINQAAPGVGTIANNNMIMGGGVPPAAAPPLMNAPKQDMPRQPQVPVAQQFQQPNQQMPPQQRFNQQPPPMAQQQIKRQKIAGQQQTMPQQAMKPMAPTPPMQNMGTPMMNGNNMRARQAPPQQMPQQTTFNQPMPAQQQQQPPQRMPQQHPPQPQPPMPQTTAGGNNGRPVNVASQQQQQILQNTLTPEERQEFRQLQVKIQGYQQMANTGVAPNGQQLTAQQKQTSLNHAKAYQQRLIQKFPLYFQRVTQFRMLQQQRQQQQQQNMMNQQQRR
ncbi:transcription factor Spt20p [Diutina catenulata]